MSTLKNLDKQRMFEFNEYNENDEDDYEENHRAPPTRSALETRNGHRRESSVQSEDSANDQTAPTRSTTESVSRRSRFQPYKDVLTENELQVKIADLGNGCWTV